MAEQQQEIVFPVEKLAVGIEDGSDPHAILWTVDVVPAKDDVALSGVVTDDSRKPQANVSL